MINGRRRELRIVGLALTPEYIYTIRGGELIPDEKRFGIFWMERRALAAAFNMEGGFNDVVLSLMHGASEPEVISRLDDLLKPYGGLGAIPRKLQISHWYLENELLQLENIGAIVPIIFLAVAAFLLNIVLTRIVSVQREEIAVIKAVGYSNAAVALHYLLWSLIVATLGCLLGVGFGAWFGRGMTRLYTTFFEFPILEYRLLGRTVIESVGISLTAAALGALFAVRRAVRLPPAEAMRPEPPARYSVSWVERLGMQRFISQPARMILRSLQRHPGRALVSLFGIAMGGALLILGSFSLDAMNVMMDNQFNVAQRYDMMVSFVEPTSSRARHELQRFPGVINLEPYRAVAVRLRFDQVSRYTAITGVQENPRLSRLIDSSFAAVDLPPDGLVLSAKLAEVLGAKLEDIVTIEVLEGRRGTYRVPVSRLVDEYMGINAYMRLDALNRLMQEGDTLSGAYLQVDRAHEQELFDRVKSTPRVAGVMLKRAALESFSDTISEMIGSVRVVNTLFAVIIAFGVVYNSARISLSERSRELATLRVIGFRRAEISYILLGELALIALAAVPLGMLLGYGLAGVMVQGFNNEIWRMPFVVSPRTYAMSGITVVSATVVSSMIVRRRLDKLDLIEVLKTRE